MIKIKTLILILLMSQASSVYANTSMLPVPLKTLCADFNTGRLFATIYENVPSPGIATIVTVQGNKSTLRITEKTLSVTSGCLVTESISKVLFHPYYQFNLEGKFSYGAENTRCAGRPIQFSSFIGTYNAEMQNPIKLKCETKLYE